MKPYKFVSYEEWENNYSTLCPRARSNTEKTEVVIVCGDGTHTREGAIAYINSAWPESEGEM